MRFFEIDLISVYVAPISVIMVAAWVVTNALRRVADRFGLMRHVWHPALFVFAVYMIVLSSIVLVIARGINVSNAQPNQQGLATVNPTYTWVRLAQRVPVRVEIDHVPDGVTLVAGMTATVQIDARSPSAK